MGNRKHDIEKYLRGELSPAEMHALEKEALNDPFLSEALEGIEQAGADNFLYDLHQLNRSVHDRARRSSRKNNKVIRIWGWTAAVAATIMLIAVSGFLVINILREQRAREQSMNKTPDAPKETPPTKDTISASSSESAGLPLVTEEDKEEVQKPTPRKKPSAPKDTSAPLTKPAEHEPVVADVTVQKDAPSGEVLARDAADDDKSKNDAQAERQEVARAEEAKKAVAGEAVAAEREKSRAFDGRAAGVAVQRGAAPSAQVMPREPMVVKGKVTDERGDELPGVNVVVDGTDIKAVTDAEGRYELSLPDKDQKLTFSFIGFESKQVDVKDPSATDVTLEEDIATLSEVVVTGYAKGQRTSNDASFRSAEPTVGKNDFKNYLANSVKYPRQAIENKTEGKVTVRFTVEPTGQLTDFEVVKGIGSGCEEELIRAIQQGPYWKPSTNGDQPVRDKVSVRFKFQLPK